MGFSAISKTSASLRLSARTGIHPSSDSLKSPCDLPTDSVRETPNPLQVPPQLHATTPSSPHAPYPDTMKPPPKACATAARTLCDIDPNPSQPAPKCVRLRSQVHANPIQSPFKIYPKPVRILSESWTIPPNYHSLSTHSHGIMTISGTCHLLLPYLIGSDRLAGTGKKKSCQSLPNQYGRP